MRRSIRLALTVWVGLLLGVSVGAFGGVMYATLRRSTLAAVDSRLALRAQALAAALRPAGDRFEMDLPPGALGHHAIWDSAGGLVDRSDAALDVPGAAPGARDRGDLREVAVEGPRGAVVLVGRDIRAERERLGGFLAATVASGAALVAAGLALTWTLVGRSLRPIERMSEAAEAISAGRLSKRIDVAHTEDELGRLAATLNGAFDRLEKALERQGRFTADASHELRTPLSIVLTHADLALRRERPPEEYREALQTILKAGDRMRALVESLLTLARADAGMLELRRDEVDLAAVARETVELLGPTGESRQVTLHVGGERATVTGDRDRLREVVLNLVTNAIQYNRPGGRVDVALAREDGLAVLTVADTGLGIPERDRPHIFERFYRVDQARSRDAGGCGLGLAIAKGIVEAHGGTIGFESREGEGTTFRVRLPGR